MEPTCRVCLQEQEDLMVYIYEQVEDLQSDLSTLLEQCGNIRMDKHDKYPKYLCRECTSELLIAFAFREKCARTQKLLEEIEAELHLQMSEQVQKERNEQNEFISDSELVEEVDPMESCASSPEQSTACEQYFQIIREEEVAKDPKESCDQYTEPSDLIVIEYENAEDIIPPEKCDASQDDSTHDEVDLVGKVLPTENFDSNESMTIAGPNVAGGFLCDCCGAFFQQAPNLRRHMERVHVELDLFNCVKCRHCFSNESACEEHSRVCSGQNNAAMEKVCETFEAGKSECPHCRKQMQSSFALKMHLRTHTGERPFVCEQCGKSFKTQSALQGHKRRHLGEAEYFCEVCQKAFYDSSNLKVHMRTHTKERPHSCSVCGKSFSRVFLLELHMRTHTGEKPYTCAQCSRAFAQLCDLRNHVLTHSGERRFKCPVCAKAFIKRQPMLLHMMRHSSFDPTDANDAMDDGQGATELNSGSGAYFGVSLNDNFNMSELIVTDPIKQRKMEEEDAFDFNVSRASAENLF